jgi:uncharacterized RDD family membrane protein YckC/type II secretory pathway pseudopilin PulG
MYGTTPSAPVSPAVEPRWAGFWLRLAAALVDGVVLFLGAMVLNLFVGFAVGVAMGASRADPETLGPVLGGSMLAVNALAGWLYFALMESSGRQATLGKMALGLAVADGNGYRIGFGRATGRHLAKLLSMLPAYLGFLGAAFTRRKQALHDLLAGTVVYRTRDSAGGVIVAVIAAAAVLGVVLVGILAAIAIPNFMRYQLRSRDAEAPLLSALLAAEQEHAAAAGAYLPLEVPAGARPGAAKLAWSPDDAAAAAELGWASPEASYFTYRVAVADGEVPALAACAEADLDADGTFTAWVAYLPGLDDAGEVIAPPPPAPCAFQRDREGGLQWDPELEPGRPLRITSAQVF